MQPWMPGVRKIDRGGGTPVQSNGPTVIVVHTTETDRRASYNGTEPHFEIDKDGSAVQFIGLDRTAKALYNAPGGGETNRRRGRIIQFELVNRAGQIRTISDLQLRGFAECLRFVDSQLPFQKVGPPQGFHGAGEGIVLASARSPIRFSQAAWESFGGICGHQHVIENDHWDPGNFPMDRLLPLLGVNSLPPAQRKENPNMYLTGSIRGSNPNLPWIIGPGTKAQVSVNTFDELRRGGVPVLPDLSAEAGGDLIDTGGKIREILADDDD